MFQGDIDAATQLLLFVNIGQQLQCCAVYMSTELFVFVEQNCHVCALKYCSIHDAKLNSWNGQLLGTDLVLILGLPRWT
jgi:hypothetical protein